MRVAVGEWEGAIVRKPLQDRNPKGMTRWNAVLAMLDPSGSTLNTNSGNPRTAGVSRTPMRAQHQYTALVPRQRIFKMDANVHNSARSPSSIGTPTAARKQLPHDRAGAISAICEARPTFPWRTKRTMSR